MSTMKEEDKLVHRLIEDVEHVDSPVAGERQPKDQHREGGHCHHLSDCSNCHNFLSDWYHDHFHYHQHLERCCRFHLEDCFKFHDL